MKSIQYTSFLSSLHYSSRDINTKESSLRHICVVHFSSDSHQDVMIHYLRVATILNLNTWTEQGESWMREGNTLYSTNCKVLFFFKREQNLFNSWVNVSDLQSLLHPIVRLNWSPRANICLSLCQHQPMGAQCDGSLTNQSWLKCGLQGVIWVCEWTVLLSVTEQSVVSCEWVTSGLTSEPLIGHWDPDLASDWSS